jgi:hypothetical protein
MSGTLLTHDVAPTEAGHYDLATAQEYYDNVWVRAVKLLDQGQNNFLGIVSGENLSGNATLTVIMNDASRSLTVAGSATISGTTSGTNTGDKLGVKVISGDTGAATANAQEDTFNILTGNDAIITAGASKTITIKGPKIQTALAWTDLDTDAWSLTDPGPTNHNGGDFYYGMSDRSGGYWSTETVTCAKDGFLVVEVQCNSLVGSSAQFYVTNDPAVPPDATTILARCSFGDPTDTEAQTMTVPVKAGSNVLLYKSGQPTSDIRVIQARFYPIYAA